jgi:cell division transport system permease protein
MTEPSERMTEAWDAITADTSLLPQRVAGQIVPSGSIAGRSLTAVVAIMTFLAALTTGAVALVVSAAGDWQSDVSREITIQVRPQSGRDLDADVASAVDVARKADGIGDVRAYSQQESAALVEPWLGSGLKLSELPIPRMIVVKLLPGATPDFAALRQALSAQAPSASLDDHRSWIDRMRTMAASAVVIGLVILALVIFVTILSVTFATRGAMATNHSIVEVLHYVGATDSFVARQFQRHFLILGLKGGLIGGGTAILLFGVLGAANHWLSGTPPGDEIAALFGNLSLSAAGYFAILAQIGLMAMVTALASRRTVNQTLAAID